MRSPDSTSLTCPHPAGHPAVKGNLAGNLQNRTSFGNLGQHSCWSACKDHGSFFQTGLQSLLQIVGYTTSFSKAPVLGINSDFKAQFFEPFDGHNLFGPFRSHQNQAGDGSMFFQKALGKIGQGSDPDAPGNKQGIFQRIVDIKTMPQRAKDVDRISGLHL